MREMRQLGDDLDYVRRTLRSSQSTASPTRIYLLWALITLPGFALIDFRPHATGWYWLIAAPAGFLMTAFLAWDYWRRMGQSDMRMASHQLQHWAGMLVVIGLAALMVRAGDVSHDSLGKVILLLLVLAFWLAGVHLEAHLRWAALLMAAGYVVLVLLSIRYMWTVLGLSVAIGLILAGLSGKRKNAKKTD
jgi:hypothetical protein